MKGKDYGTKNVHYGGSNSTASWGHKAFAWPKLSFQNFPEVAELLALKGGY